MRIHCIWVVVELNAVNSKRKRFFEVNLESFPDQMTTTRLISVCCIFSFICTIYAVPLWCGRPYYSFNRTSEEFANPPNNYFVVNPSVQPFTSEKQGELLVNIDPNYGDSVTFQAKLNSIFVVSPIRLTTGVRHDLAIDVTKFPLGQYSTVNCQIKTNGGELIAQTNVSVSRWPDKSNAVKIDHKSGGLFYNGLPTLPMGYYFDWGRPQLWDVITAEAETGFTAPLPYRPPLHPLDGVKQIFDYAQKLGTKMILDIVSISEGPPSKDKFGNITAVVNSMKDHPALLAYYIADEPDGGGIYPENVISSYKLIKQLDPYHPVILVLNCLYNINNYTQGLDIIMTDPYPIGITDSDACDYCKGEPMDIWHRFTAYKAQTQGRYPMWLVPQAFGGAEEWTRQPTAAEERAMTYLALINDVRGIIYFTEGIPFAGLWAACRQLTEEVAELTPWFMSHKKANEISIESRDLVDGSLNRNVKGKAYLHQGYLMVVLVNGRNAMESVKVTIKDLDPSATAAVEIFQQNRAAVILNGIFTDVLDGYASRAYRIALKPHANNSTKNLVRNPSFELTPSVSRPDSYSFYVSDGSSFGTDTRTAIDGLKSMRVHCFNESCADLQNGLYQYYDVQAFGVTLNAGQSYRASFYMRADRPGIKVAFYILTDGNSKYLLNQLFTATTDWQKYTVQPFKVANSGGYWPRLIVLSPGTVWFDVLSVEPSN